MADRTSARIFGSIFEYLAENPDDRAKAFAADMWRLKEEAGCDFSDYQMDADDALITLGLAVHTDGNGIAYVGDEEGPALPKRNR